MTVVFVTIHKGDDTLLFSTIKSILPHLFSDFAAGYIIYRSGQPLELPSKYHHPLLIYLDGMPVAGIVSAMNSAQSYLLRYFPQASHHCFIHSGDSFSPSPGCLQQLDALVGSGLNWPDLIFFNYRFLGLYHHDIFKPDFKAIRKSMSVPHMGTFIGNALHQQIGGYSRAYEIAMDYDFFLKASVLGCSWREVMQVNVSIEGFGLSSRRPYLGLRDVFLSKLRVLFKAPMSRFSLRFLCLIFDTFNLFVRRFAYDFFQVLSPSLLRLLRRKFNPRVIESSIPRQ